MVAVHLTDRAMQDLVEIERYSIEQWGRRVAGRYLDDIGAAIERIGSKPTLLQPRPETSLRLMFYPARAHVLVCDVIGERVFVLAVRHAVMDLPRRVCELEPSLVHEAELMAARIEDELQD